MSEKRSTSVSSMQVRRLRRAKGWTQQELAARAYCSKKTIENVENGKPVSASILATVAEALGVDLAGLQTPAPPLAAGRGAAEARLTDAGPEKPGRYKLLIVDDSEGQRPAIVRAAQDVGFTDILEAGSEANACELIDRYPFDVAVADVMLSEPPGKYEGLRVMERLSRQQPGCKIIGLTTSAGDAAGPRGAPAGAHDFICSKWQTINWVALLRHRLLLWKSMIELPDPAADVLS